MTLDELIKLDRYGHQALSELAEVQLSEYYLLLNRRQREVSRLIKKVNRKAYAKVA